jgi:hypothetical protein
MSDLKELMDEAVDGYLPRVDEETVRRRVRRRRQGGRIMATALALGLCLGVGWFGWAALRPPSRTVPAADSGTYRLTNFEVRPYSGPRASADRATVSFQVFWSSDVFPGDHECSIRVYDSSGSVIGMHDFPVVALSEGHRGKEGVPIDGPIEGATADGSCSRDRLDTPVAYVVKDLRIDVPDFGFGNIVIGNLAQVVFTAGTPASLPAGAYPGANACQAAIFAKDGRLIKSSDFTVTVGTEGRVEVDFPNYGEQVPTTTNVVCEPFTREGKFPDAVGSSADDTTYP